MTLFVKGEFQNMVIPFVSKQRPRNNMFWFAIFLFQKLKRTDIPYYLFVDEIVDGYSTPVKWTYSNTNSVEHPIVKVLMKRIEVGNCGEPQKFSDWFPDFVYGKDAISYILDIGWNKPREPLNKQHLYQGNS